VPKTANAFQSNNGIAYGSIVASLFFYFFLIDEIQSRQRKWKSWALKTVAAAASTFIL
jgi:hypothetical protein